jgi:hypothetical protein
VTVLNVVVADLFVSEGLVGFGEFDVEVVEGFNSFVLGRVRSNFVGVELEGKSLVVRLDLLLIEGLVVAVSIMIRSCRVVAGLTSEMPRIS